MRKTKKVLSLTLASAMVLSLAACGGGGTETTAADTEATTAAVEETTAKESEETTAEEAESTDSGEGFNLSVCLASEPQAIDPALNSAVDGAIMINHMFEGLTKWVDDGNGNAILAPGQAESFEKVENEDGTVNEESTQKINKSIEEYTDEIIARYEADVKAADGEGNMSVNLDYTVIKDSDRLFSIRFDQLLVMASGTQLVKIYHIDKQTGEMINLAGLFREGTDFITPISDNIKKQMKEQMEADEMITYWLDSETPEWDFQSVREDSTFYVNEKGNLVIVFDEYEVAPGYMGSVEFEIPDEVTRDLVQEGFLGN